ncbi:MAG: response regulator [Deltaproteobacteria bacterium]|nr:response regulator [Candidatus Zymogenaceae bacterium]
MKILVVDDEPTIRDYLEETLTEMGQEVVTVADGYAAIDYVRDHEVDLAYIDVMMPGIDGYETLKRMREIEPKVSSVLISGNAVDQMLGNSIPKGVFVCLKKPITIEQLEEVNRSFETIRGPLEFIYENPYGLDEQKIVDSRILIADDEAEISNIISETLSAEGFTHIDSAADGQQAIGMFNDKKHDVVILDIMMPKRNGIEVLRHVKAVSPSSQVIIITGNADKNSAIAAVKLGAYDYIEKPFELDTIVLTTKRAIEKRLLLSEGK